MTHGLLDELKRETKIPVTAPRLAPEKKWEALKWLFHYKKKERFSLDEWEETVSFLLGCQVRFSCYGEINRSLKPFSLELR